MTGTNAPASSMARLPQELVDVIIDRFCEEPHLSSLARLTTVSSAFVARTQAHLYHDVVIRDQLVFEKFRSTVLIAPHLASITRTLLVVDPGVPFYIDDGRWQGMRTLWLETEAGKGVLDVIQSLPNLDCLKFKGEEPIPLDGSTEESRGIPLFHEAAVFRLPNIRRVGLNTVEAASCHNLFSLFMDSAVEELAIEKHQHTGDCSVKTATLPNLNLPLRKIHFKALALQLSECMLRYLLHSNCVVELSSIQRLSISWMPFNIPSRNYVSSVLGPGLLELDIIESSGAMLSSRSFYDLSLCQNLQRLKWSGELHASRLRPVKLWEHLLRLLDTVAHSNALTHIDIAIEVGWHDIRTSYAAFEDQEVPGSPDFQNNDEILEGVLNWDALDAMLAAVRFQRLEVVRLDFRVLNVPEGHPAVDLEMLRKKGFPCVEENGVDVDVRVDVKWTRGRRYATRQ